MLSGGRSGSMCHRIIAVSAYMPVKCSLLFGIVAVRNIEHRQELTDTNYANIDLYAFTAPSARNKLDVFLSPI